MSVLTSKTPSEQSRAGSERSESPVECLSTERSEGKGQTDFVQSPADKRSDSGRETARSVHAALRILSIDGDTAIVLDCFKMTMPVQMPVSALADCPTFPEDELQAALGIRIREESDLSPAERKSMHERYTLIAPILPFAADPAMRSMMISGVSEQSGIGKQTIRKHLCRYLTFQMAEALAPEKTVRERALNDDEKNFRWALNKYYYTQRNRDFFATARSVRPSSDPKTARLIGRFSRNFNGRPVCVRSTDAASVPVRSNRGPTESP